MTTWQEHIHQLEMLLLEIDRLDKELEQKAAAGGWDYQSDRFQVWNEIHGIAYQLPAYPQEYDPDEWIEFNPSLSDILTDLLHALIKHDLAPELQQELLGWIDQPAPRWWLVAVLDCQPGRTPEEAAANLIQSLQEPGSDWLVHVHPNTDATWPAKPSQYAHVVLVDEGGNWTKEVVTR